MSITLTGAGMAVDTAAPGSTYSQDVLNTTGLVSYWHLAEPSGTSAADSKGSNTGTYVGTPTLAQTTLVTGGDTSVLFNGTTQWVSIAGGVSLQPASPTVEAWIKPTSIVAERHVMSFADGCFVLLWTPTGKVQALFYNGVVNRTTTGATTLVASTKYHVAASFNNVSKDLKVYVNGVEDGTTNYPADSIAWDATTTSFLGAGFGGFEPAPTVLDEVAYYNVAVPQATLLAHYTKGA